MIVLVCVLILLSSYVIYAKMKDETKTSYFIFVSVIVVLIVISQVFSSGGSA